MMYALDEVTGACHSVSCTLRRSWPMIWMACHTKTLSFLVRHQGGAPPIGWPHITKSNHCRGPEAKPR